MRPEDAVEEIRLTPLGSGDLAHLIADTLHCEPQRAAPLAQLIHGKTAGNPFFAIQFIHALAEEALITFEHADARWRWDLDAIRAKGYTDNVVDLMVAKLNRLPATTQKALQQLACVGNSAEISTLAAVLETSEQETEAALWEALQLELIVRSEDSWRFVHDRVQEAAYSLIAEEAGAEAHLRIGRLLHAHIPPEKREEAIFEIVNQYNRGAGLITSEDERFQVAELNLIAGKRAKASTAYASALQYFIAGEALLTDAAWERRPRSHFPAGIAPGRMRVPDRRAGHCGRTRGITSIARRGYRRTGDGHLPGHRCLHDAWSDGPCRRHRPRLSAASSVSNGRSIQRRNRYEANTSGSGHNSEIARSRRLLTFL